MSKVKYGIIGCGWHALHGHAIPGKEIPELELCGVYDIQQRSVANFCRDFGSELKNHGTIEQLLASDIDAVLIASPDEFHIQQLRLALEAGKHVLVEKPLAVNDSNLRELRSLLPMALERDLVVTTCHPRRFDPPFLWLKSQMARFNRLLGPVLGFRFDFSYHRPEAAWKASRSLLLDHLNHEIDLLHYFHGICPFIARMEHDSFDRYLVTGMREDGIAFSFHGTRRLENKLYLEWLTVRYERGEVKIDTHAGSAKIFSHETEAIGRADCGKTDYPIRSNGVMRNFADAILGRAPNYLTLEDLWVNNWLGVDLLENKESLYE